MNTYPTDRGFTAIGTGGEDFVHSMVDAVESVLQESIPKVGVLNWVDMFSYVLAYFRGCLISLIRLYQCLTSSNISFYYIFLNIFVTPNIDLNLVCTGPSQSENIF